MNKFKVGQVVRCIDANGGVVKGQIYRIEELQPPLDDEEQRYRVYGLIDSYMSIGDGLRERRFEAL